MSSTTLNWQMREILHHLNTGGRLPVLLAYVLRANRRSRAWPSIDRLIKDTGLSRPTVIAAKAWLLEHGAILPIPNDKRMDKECDLHHLIDVFEITGILFIDGKEYTILYSNKDDNSEDEILGKNSLRKEFYTEVIKESIEEGRSDPSPVAFSDNSNDNDPSPFLAYERWIAPMTALISKQLDKDIEIYGAARLCEAFELTQQRYIEGICKKPNYNYAIGICKSWLDNGYDGESGHIDNDSVPLEAWL